MKKMMVLLAFYEKKVGLPKYSLILFGGFTKKS
jgi:hypothetical protein